jgi:mRNA interferase RelE/StbE
VSYTVTIGRHAERAFRRLTPQVQQRVAAAIGDLSNNPRPHGARKLKATKPEGWRLRVGDYRVLYTVNDLRKEAVIYRISHRGKAY